MHIDSDDIIENAIEQFWGYVGKCNCVAFFEQKYDHQENWEKIRCVVYPYEGMNDDIKMIFDWDFCEGQTDVRSIVIVALDDILDFYETNGGLKNGD